MSNRIKGLAKGLIEEMIKADLTMHEMQMEEWARIARNRPEGDDIPANLMQGFGANRYLSLMETEFGIYIKRKPQSLIERIKLAWRVLLGKTPMREDQEYEFQLCQANESGAQQMTLKIKRLDDGKIKASYLPADGETNELMTA
ncbi:MAG: hypothetical protein ACI82Q_003039 [Nonlabens sp.]